jgi:V8-like Glu-specific endopeptidase
MDKETIKALRNTLANLYPTERESRVVAQSAGLPAAHIAFDPQAILNWFAILRQAEIRNKTMELVKEALEDFPDHPLLRQIQEKGEVEPTQAPVIGQGLPWLSTASADSFEKLMGKESTLLPISFLETGLQRSRSVARVKFPDGSTGSGFLTRDNIFVTNHHVFGNEDDAKNAVIQFNYQDDARGLDLEPVNFSLDPAKGFATSAENDWTLVRVEGDANADWGKIDLTAIGDYDKLQYVNIIQHPSGGPKQIALYHNIVAYADDKRIQYLTDTLEGSSGSPVFDNRWRVVALHHSGGNIIEPETKKPVFRNEGININIIVEALGKNLI